MGGATRGIEAAAVELSAAWGTIEELGRDFVELLPLLVIAAVVFAIFWGIAGLVRRGIRRAWQERQNANVGVVLGRVAFALVLVLGALVAVTIVAPSMTPGRLLSVLGIGGVAIGFAFKDVLQNLFAGILILLREPFKVGDEITSGDFTGTVEAIETRATFIRTYDGQRVIIPNGTIYTEPVTVITAYGNVRSQYDVGVGYGDDIEKARQLALQVMRDNERVLDDPAPDCLTWELADSTVNLRLRWWTDARRSNVVRVRDEILRAVFHTMAEHHIDLPFPTQVLLFHDQTEATDGDRTRQREGWPAGDNPPAARNIASVLAEHDAAVNGRDRGDGKQPATSAPH